MMMMKTQNNKSAEIEAVSNQRNNTVMAPCNKKEGGLKRKEKKAPPAH